MSESPNEKLRRVFIIVRWPWSCLDLQGQRVRVKVRDVKNKLPRYSQVQTPQPQRGVQRGNGLQGCEVRGKLFTYARPRALWQG